LISKKRITVIASASVLIALLASMQTIDFKNDAYAADDLIPKWIKKTAVFWATSPEVSDSVYLDAMAWLINNGIMKVDTVTAAPSSTSDAVIDDIVGDIASIEYKLELLEKFVDKMDSREKGSLEYETVIMVDKPCSMGRGFCPGSAPSMVDTFYILEDLKDVDSIIVNVHATSVSYPSCSIAGYGEDTLPTDRFGIKCESNPGEGSVLVYTLIKGDGKLLRGIELAGERTGPTGGFPGP